MLFKSPRCLLILPASQCQNVTDTPRHHDPAVSRPLPSKAEPRARHAQSPFRKPGELKHILGSVMETASLKERLVSQAACEPANANISHLRRRK